MGPALPFSIASPGFGWICLDLVGFPWAYRAARLFPPPAMTLKKRFDWLDLLGLPWINPEKRDGLRFPSGRLPGVFNPPRLSGEVLAAVQEKGEPIRNPDPRAPLRDVPTSRENRLDLAGFTWMGPALPFSIASPGFG